jgi:hypothetical protein
MRLVVTLSAVVLAIPVVALVAVMAGPVSLVLLCGAGFGLIVFVAGNAAVALGLLGRSAERATVRHLHR